MEFDLLKKLTADAERMEAQRAEITELNREINFYCRELKIENPHRLPIFNKIAATHLRDELKAKHAEKHPAPALPASQITSRTPTVPGSIAPAVVQLTGRARFIAAQVSKTTLVANDAAESPKAEAKPLTGRARFVAAELAKASGQTLPDEAKSDKPLRGRARFIAAELNKTTTL